MRRLAKWLWRFWKLHPLQLAIILIFSILNAAIGIAYPYILKYIFDGLEAEFSNENLTRLALLFLGVGVAAYFVYIILQGTRAYMNIRLEFHFRQWIFEHLTKLSPSFFNKFTTGDLVTRLTDDITEKLSWFSCSGIFRTYEALLTVIFCIGAMLTLNVKLTLYAVGPLPFIVFVFIKTATVLHKRFDRVQRAISHINNVMESCFSGIKVIKAYNREKAQKEVFSKAVEDRKKAEVKAAVSYSIIDSLWSHIWQLGIVVILLVGGKMVINGNLTIGDFVAFDTYMLMLIYPMFDIGQFVVSGRRGVVSYERLRELEEISPDIEEPKNPISIGDRGLEIEFRNVGFSFDGDRKALKSINFKIRSGETVALVGSIGSGKSTILALLTRLFDPTEGEILVNGHSLKNLSLEEWRKLIGYIPQEPMLFSDTIESNVVFHRSSITEEMVHSSIKSAQMADEVSGLHNGSKTFIGTRGVNLSGGQKQRLSLARALAGRPKLLLLDDCTASLDAETEIALWKRLKEIMPETSSLLVSHRTQTIKNADFILVLDNGEIIERGSHKELIDLGGVYKKLYEKQLLVEAVGLS